MRLSSPLLLGLAALALPACSGPNAAGPDGNVVFLSRLPCETFVVKTYGGDFGVLENRDGRYAPQAADLLEGDLGRGDAVLQFIPAGALRQGEDARAVDVRVVARGLSVEDAQARFSAACPLPPASDETAPLLDVEIDGGPATGGSGG